MIAPPVIYVLAGVNGAGKSSIGGYALSRVGMTWYNPDTFARELVSKFGYQQSDANGIAWGEGFRRLNEAMIARQSYAFETTLGGESMIRKLIEASRTHQVLVWYCSLKDPEQHIARVKLRVKQGGHHIPEEKIRERWVKSMLNLVSLLPHVTHLQAYDNSTTAELGQNIPNPQLVLEVSQGRCLFPKDRVDLAATPNWAKPLVMAAMRQQI